MKKVYVLKPMAMARLLAEATGLLVLVCLPILMLTRPDFQHLTGTVKIALWIAAAVALMVLPFYGFVTWKVSLDEQGLHTHALFRKQFLAWSKMRRLLLRTSWNWKRYAIQGQEAEISFPIWLNAVSELTDVIRGRLPQHDSAGSSEEITVYAQDSFSLWLQFGRVALGLLFIAVFWFFYASVGLSARTTTGDSLLVLLVCFVVSGIVGWRCFVIATLPTRVVLNHSGILVRTCFSQREIPWPQLLRTTSPFFLLPEGLLVKTTAGSFLIGDNLDGADELQRKICQRIAAGKEG